MSWILGDTTLPRPNDFRRVPIEVSVEHVTIDGSQKKDVSAQREQFVLAYKYLTQVQVAQIMSEWAKQAAVTFSVSDGSLSIPATSVLVKIGERSYTTAGAEYREDLVLILTEVS